MTKQELFMKVVDHVVTQGEPSVTREDGEIQCLYKGPNELKCAAGIFVPDRQAPLAEGQNFTGVNKELGLGFTDSEAAMIQDLQACHDNASAFDPVDKFVESFLERSQVVWDRYNLG